MLLLRRIATAIVIAAALAVVFLSVYLLWNARQNDYLPQHPSYTPDLRVQQLEEKLEIYSRRVNDMEKLVIILLGISGLYVLVFILTADLNTRSMRRTADRALESVRSQIDDSMRALRDLKEEISHVIRAEAKDAVDRSGDAAPDLQTIQERIATLTDGAPSDEQRQEIANCESALPALELLHAAQFGPQLARIYRTLARYHDRRDPVRAHFYLARVHATAPEDFETANQLANLALDRQPPDYRQARRYFEASLAAQPEQQCAKYGLARIALAEGNSEIAIGLLEGALESPTWETSPDQEHAGLIRY